MSNFSWSLIWSQLVQPCTVNPMQFNLTESCLLHLLGMFWLHIETHQTLMICCLDISAAIYKTCRIWRDWWKNQRGRQVISTFIHLKALKKFLVVGKVKQMFHALSTREASIIKNVLIMFSILYFQTLTYVPFNDDILCHSDFFMAPTESFWTTILFIKFNILTFGFLLEFEF